MKRFFIRVLLAVILFVAIVNPICVKYKKSKIKSYYGYEVVHSQKKSRSCIKRKGYYLVFGDSTGNQLYNNEKNNDTIYSLTCNSCITLCGHFCLLSDFLRTNESNLPSRVVLLYAPTSLCCGLNYGAFQYFLKPFYNEHYKPYMNDAVHNWAKSVPLYWMAQVSLVKYSNYSPHFQAVKEADFEGLVSPINAVYLDSISRICREFGVPLEFRGTFTADNNRAWFAEQIEHTTNIDKHLLDQYLETVRFLPDSMFIDDVHLKKECIPTDFLGLRMIQY